MAEHAEIIAVGSELTSGASLDTNSQWLSRRLADAGITVRRHTAVADELDEMVAAFREAAARADVLIITGGLGPTLDDLTRQALAVLAGVELTLDEPALEHLRAFFAIRRRVMPERNVIQAMFPAGSEPIPNARGTAPGIWLEQRSAGRDTACRIAALPGVPSEMKPMFEEHVLPRVSSGDRVIVRHEVHCFGAGESAVEEMLGDLTARGRTPEVGITAHEATITLRISAAAATPGDARNQVDATVNMIRERLGSLVFGEQGARLEEIALRLLAERGLTLATAEIGTGGLLAQWLTEADQADAPALNREPDEPRVAGPAAYRSGSVFTARYAPLAADVPAHTREAGILLAEGCRREFSADFGLAVTAWSPTESGKAQPAAPTAWVVLVGSGGLAGAEEQSLLSDPAISRSRLAKTALNLLRLHLLNPAG